MPKFKVEISPLKFVQDSRTVVVENDFFRWQFDLLHGGELSEVLVKNGSGKNLLAWPQKSSISLLEQGSYHEYSTAQFPAAEVQLDAQASPPVLKMIQYLGDRSGRRLPGVKIERTVEFSPWGYLNFRVNFRLTEKINEVGQVQVGSFGASERFDCFTLRRPALETAALEAANQLEHWGKLHRGWSREDVPALLTRRLPLSLLIFQRGVEGIEFALHDDLMNWDGVGTSLEGRQQCFLAYRPQAGGYEVRFCPLDSARTGQFLAGNYQFGYRLTLPRVQSRMVPLRPYVGNAFCCDRGFEQRWPQESDLQLWRSLGCDLLRLHNDGDIFDNGEFWRDGAFPPYQGRELDQLKNFLAAAHRHDLAVVPYFSVKEWHPDAAGYAEHLTEWARLPDPRDPNPIGNYCGKHGIFGTQMCLESSYYEQRRSNIEAILKNYDFSGVYYDWCAGAECANSHHATGRHWDNDRLLELLTWSRQCVGENGELYLHLTKVPSLAAENLANLVLTEEASYGRIGPEMFSPHVHFMNIAPRQICDMLPAGASPEQRRQLTLCALLHHATVSSRNTDNRDLYEKMAALKLERFSRHTAPGEGIARCSANGGIAVYWHQNEAVAVVANPTEQQLHLTWEIDAATLAWSGRNPGGSLDLNPLELTAIPLRAQ